MTVRPHAEEPRTPEQLERIREVFKPDGLLRLARSTQDYYSQKGYYLPDVAALAYVNGSERDALAARVAELKTALRDESAAAKFLIGEYVEPFGECGIHMADARQIVACLRGIVALADTGEATDGR